MRNFENEFLKRKEKAIEKVKLSIMLQKIQKEYQVDIAGFGNQLRIKHPRTWEKVKKIGIEHLVKYRLNIV